MFLSNGFPQSAEVVLFTVALALFSCMKAAGRYDGRTTTFDAD